MAKQHEEAPESQESPQQITMSAADLKDIISQVVAAQIAANAENNKALAEAIRDGNKPYIDPKVAANEEAFRKNTREQQERKRKATLESQAWCQHIAGGMGEVRDPGGRTSIAWHRFDNGQTVGICTQCIRVFRESDPDFRTWFGMPKYNNKISRSGDRYVQMPVPTTTV